MVDTFKLFISAADDLSPEREIIGHLVTEIPVTLGWQINLSPTGKSLDNAQLVMDADFHLIVIGEDIRAPVGYEWHVSRRVGKLPQIFISKFFIVLKYTYLFSRKNSKDLEKKLTYAILGLE